MAKPKVLRVLDSKDIEEAVEEAARTVKHRGLIVYPTDTLYGLGADPFSEAAVNRVYEAKHREAKPMPLLVSSRDYVGRIAYVTDEARKLIQLFWPGPLTLVLSKKAVLPDLVTANLPKVGVRMPNHEVALRIIEACGGFLIGTSANISGQSPPRTIEEVLRQLNGSVDLVVDAEPLPIGVPSTVIDLTSDKPLLIREGAVRLEELEKALGKIIER